MKRKSNQRGSAILEAIPVLALLIVFVALVLSASYLLFARTWIEYQSEQALYCSAERRRGCKQQLQVRLEQFLPWGKTVGLNIHAESERWQVEVQWHFNNLTWSTHKELTIKQVLKNRGLHW